MRFTLAVRAILAFAGGLVITFAQSHAAEIGVVTFASFLTASGVLVTFMNLVSHKTPTSIQEVPVSIFALILGILAFMVPLNQGEFTHLGLIWLVASWGIVAGAFELYAAYSAGFKTQTGRERSISAGLALVLGTIYLTLPLDEISTVGLIGAYLVLSAVHLGISAASPKSAS